MKRWDARIQCMVDDAQDFVELEFGKLDGVVGAPEGGGIGSSHKHLAGTEPYTTGYWAGNRERVHNESIDRQIPKIEFPSPVMPKPIKIEFPNPFEIKPIKKTWP